MNKIYNIVWSKILSQWVVAAENARSQGKGTHSSAAVVERYAVAPAGTLLPNKLSRIALTVVAAFGSSLVSTSVMAAECGSTGSVDAYANCTASSNDYNTLRAHGAGTVVTAIAPNASVGSGYMGYAVGADSGATLVFEGSLNSYSYGPAMALAMGYYGGPGPGYVVVKGNLDAYSSYSEAIFILDGGLTVGGNLVATSNNNRNVIRGWGALNVAGTTTVSSASADGILLGGDASFDGAATIDISGANKAGLVLLGYSNNKKFKNDLTVNTIGANSVGILNYAAPNTSTTTVEGALKVSTIGVNSTGIDNGAGAFTALGNSTVTTSGAGAIGVNTTYTPAVNTTGSATNFNHLTVNTSGVNATGVAVTGVGATSTIGSGSAITTTGASAHGVRVVDGAINLAESEVKTSGDGANGIWVTNNTTSGVQLNTPANVTTTGADSHGVVLSGNEVTATNNATITGNISATGTGSTGITMTTGGAANLTVGGNVTATSTGVLVGVVVTPTDAAQPRNVTITTTAGKTIYSAEDDAITVFNNTTAGTSTITNVAALVSATGDGIDAVGALGGSTITNSGDITATTAGQLVIAGGDAIDTVTTTAGTLTGNTDLGAGNDSFTASGGALVGKTMMGNDSDVMTITGAVDLTGTTLLDGGNSTDATVTDILGTAGAATNKLNFVTTTQSLAGSLMKNWQTVLLDNSNITFAGDAALDTGVGTNSDGSLQGLVLKNASTLTSPIALAVTGDVNIDATSTLNHALGGSITGDVTNAGMIYWQNLGQTLTINGNYTGAAGNLSLGTDLGDDSSVTDKLVITGNSSGTTAVTVRPAGTSAGAQTNVGIDVIDVAGTSGAVFTLASPVQAGAYEYVLKKGGNGGVANNWYLTSTYDCSLNSSCVTPIVPIYRPSVALYTTAQTANADLGYLALDTLHQRMGEQQGVSTAKPQTWVRMITGYTSNSGKNRFEYDQTSVGFQIGRDLLQSTASNGTQQHAGLTTQYLRGNVDTRDRVRPLVGLSENTGGLQTTAYGLGGYYTRMTDKGTYLDLVTQVNRLDNQFNDVYGGSSKQKGWQAGLSAEVGTPFGQIKGWQFEHQAQLSYLYGSYGDFSDQFSNISSLNTHNLRARLGLRVHKQTNPDSAKSAQYYGIVNLHQDLISPKSIQLTSLSGSNTVGVSEKYDRTTWELGAGVQHPLGKDTYFYGDARYEQSFGDRKHSGKITFGIKSSF